MTVVFRDVFGLRAKRKAACRLNAIRTQASDLIDTYGHNQATSIAGWIKSNPGSEGQFGSHSRAFWVDVLRQIKTSSRINGYLDDRLA